MTKKVIISILILVRVVLNLTTAHAQNPFVYEKGKTFKDISSYRMEKAINLKVASTPVPVVHQHVVARANGMARPRYVPLLRQHLR